MDDLDEQYDFNELTDLKAASSTSIDIPTSEKTSHVKINIAEKNINSHSWRAILLLQFEFQFKIVIYFCILLSYVFVMVDFAHAVVLNGMRTDFHLKPSKILYNIRTYFI